MKGIYKKKKRSLAEWGFLISIFFWPSFCFIWGNIFVNINSFVLAFSTYEEATSSFVYNAGLANFKDVIRDFSYTPEFALMVKNSAIRLLVGVAMLPFPLFVSFMIYKKCPGSKVFIVILFLPSIISSIIWVMAYKYMMDYVIPELFNLKLVTSLLMSGDAFTYLLIYTHFMGFAGGLVIYTGAMARIPHELVEYGRLEGLTAMGEFFRIVIPLIYPTLVVMLIGLPEGFFSGSPSTFAFYSTDARPETWTIGYYFFSILLGSTGKAKKYMYPYASAAGLLFTVIAIPLTFGWKALLNKFDPEVEY